MKIYNMTEFKHYFKFKIEDSNKSVGIILNKCPEKYVVTFKTYIEYFEKEKLEVPIYELIFNEKFIEALKNSDEKEFQYNDKLNIEIFLKMKNSILSMI